MFTVEKNRNSSFVRWDVESFDARKLSHRESSFADTVGTDWFRFEALEGGEATIEFKLTRTTVFGEETAGTSTVEVNIKGRPTVPSDDQTPEIESGAPTISDEVANQLSGDDGAETSETSSEMESGSPPSQDRSSAAIDSESWKRVQELIEMERYAAAQDIIEKQIENARGSDKQSWQNQLAELLMKREQYTEAAGVWESMISEFPQGNIPRWRYKMARAYREAGRDNDAELELLKIRHRHRDSGNWVDAMVELGEIAISRGNYERAREILENARQPLKDRDNPQLIMRLAQMYDQYKPVRDYERAVRLYETVAEALKNKDPETAKKARSRANHLKNNYVNFGFD